MRKIRYKFITEETVEVEVNDKLGAIIQAMNDAEANIDRAEGRRHDSLEEMERQGVQYSASDDVVAAVEQFMMVFLWFHSFRGIVGSESPICDHTTQVRKALCSLIFSAHKHNEPRFF